MDIIDKLIKEYTEKYELATTKSKRKRIAEELLSISYLYYNCLENEDMLLWDKEGGIEEFDINKLDAFFYNIIDNKDLLFEISKNIIDVFKNSDFNFNEHYYDFYKKHNIIPKEEFFTIIRDFLSNFDNSLVDDFNRLLDNKEAIFLDTYDTAFACSFNNIDSSLLVFNDNFNNNFSVEFGCVLMHEFGHRLEFNLYNNRTNFIDRHELPFYEVASCFLEFAFINYLIDNNIYKEDAEKYLNEFLMNLICYAIDINLFASMDIKDYDYDNCVDLDEYNELRKEMYNELNYFYIEDADGSAIRDAHIYGLGIIIGFYIYEFYKKNKKDFLKHYKNALINYPYTKDISSFEEVGVNKEIISKADFLKKILKK